MSTGAEEEQQVLETNLSRALDDAWNKANNAVESLASTRDDHERNMWAAAEATEYASLLYALAHGLEDTNPTVDTRKHEEPIVLLKESILALEKARNETGSDKQSHLRVYGHIREAVTGLRTAYLQTTRKSKEGSSGV